MKKAVARLIVDPPASGQWNMSVDQALLESAESQKHTTLRFYEWSAPTLSLGYFQAFKDREQHEASKSCDIIRRASGGGAILHHHELTYSLSVSSSNRWSKRNSELYDLVHTELIEVLRELGLETSLFKDQLAADNETFPDSAFLCFQRRSSGDLVSGPTKICGSAQRRLKNSLLQHGSILLRKSEFAPELDGVENLIPQSILPKDLSQRLTTRIGERLDLEFENSQLSQKELESAAQIRLERFGNPDWLQKR